LVTRVGKLELRAPQDRLGHFRTEVFERYQRSEKALVGAMTEMYVQGGHAEGIGARDAFKALMRDESLAYRSKRLPRSCVATVVTTGVGETVSFSSTSILFTTEQRLPTGCAIELSVNRPARLDGTLSLKFVATGRIIRAEDDRAVAEFGRYEFYTRSTRQN
jgi:hypothetical protein